MGIFKTAAKVVGTVTLSATWLASGILKHSADAVGFDLGSEIFDAGNQASASGIKRIWNMEEPEIDDQDAEIAGLEKARQARRTRATRCFDMAQAAKKAGNEEKYEECMQLYEAAMEEVRAYEEEISKVKSGCADISYEED